MATATGTGPIAIGQINSTLYAGEPGFPNTQYCVDYARNDGNYWVVVIPHGYGVNEPPISAITGGTAQIYVMDLRLPTQQLYKWDGTKYAPADFDQLAGFISRGRAQVTTAALTLGFDPAGGLGAGRGDFIVQANPGAGMPAFQLTCEPKDGTTTHTFLRGDKSAVSGSLRAIMPQSLHLLNGDGNINVWMGPQSQEITDSKGMYIRADSLNNIIDFQGETIGNQYDQAIRLNYLGGHILLGPHVLVDTAGNVTVGEGLQAQNCNIEGYLNVFGLTQTLGGVDTPHVYVGETPAISGKKGMGIVGKPAENAIDLQGETIGGAPDQTIRINALGGDVQIGINALVTEAGSLHAVRGRISSQLRVYNTDPAAYKIWVGDADVQTNAKGLVIGTDAAANKVYMQAAQVDVGNNQAIEINFGGGDVRIGPATTINGAGIATSDLHVTGTLNAPNAHLTGDLIVDGEVSADSAAFNTCLVAGSPVRTFANTPDGGGGSGMEWPPAGIGVSTGTAWGVSIAPASLATWPSAGIPVSTGTAWGTPIDPATLVLTPATVARTNTVNTFTPTQTFAGGKAIIDSNGNANFQGEVISQATMRVITTGFTTRMNFSTDASKGYIDFQGPNSSTQGGGIIRSYRSDVSGVQDIMHLDTALIDCIRPLRGLLGFNVIGDDPSLNFADSLRMFTTPANHTSYIQARGDGAGADRGTLRLGVATYAGTAAIDSLVLNTSGGATFAGAATFGGSLDCATAMYVGHGSGINLTTNATDCFIDAMKGSLYLNQNVGGTPAILINGTLYANGAKNFRIPHPLDETKELTHSCLEGPEVGVFYRGEVTTANGIAEVTLPDYFEALTYPEDRSVLLTVIVDDANPVFGAGQIAAGRVKEGKFKVYSSDPSVTIAWEVKAVRRLNVERLQVVTNKPEPEPTATPQDEKVEA